MPERAGRCAGTRRRRPAAKDPLSESGSTVRGAAVRGLVVRPRARRRSGGNSRPTPMWTVSVGRCGGGPRSSVLALLSSAMRDHRLGQRGRRRLAGGPRLRGRPFSPGRCARPFGLDVDREDRPLAPRLIGSSEGCRAASRHQQSAVTSPRRRDQGQRKARPTTDVSKPALLDHRRCRGGSRAPVIEAGGLLQRTSPKSRSNIVGLAPADQPRRDRVVVDRLRRTHIS